MCAFKHECLVGVFAGIAAEVTHACRAVREVAGTEALIYGDGPERLVVEQILREKGEYGVLCVEQ